MMDKYGVAHLGECGVPCDGVTNIDPWVQKELAAGATSLWFPADTVWTPPRNYVPGGLTIQGANWTTVIIKAADPRTEYVIVGPHTTLLNVSIFDVVEPGIEGMGKKSPRPVRQYFNLCDSDQIPTHYAWTGTMATASGLGQDLCASTLVGRGVGDIFFVGADGSATAFHGWGNSEDPDETAIVASFEAFGRGPAMHAVGLPSARTTYALVRIQQLGKGPCLMLEPDEDGEGVVVMLNGDGAGRCFHVYQDGGTNSGSPIALNMGRSGSTYDGDPIWYRNGEGPEKFRLKNDGRIESEQMTAIEQRLTLLEAARARFERGDK